jgi:hypothetical protein
MKANLILRCCSILGIFLLAIILTNAQNKSAVAVKSGDKMNSGASTSAKHDSTIFGFYKGAKTISFGYGFGLRPMNELDENYESINPLGPFVFIFEYALTDHWGIEAAADYYEATAEYHRYQGPNDIISLSSYSISVLVNFHLIHHHRTDLYGGFGVGYVNETTSSSYGQIYNTEIYFPTITQNIAPVAALGFRFQVSEKISLYTEVGGFSMLHAGIKIKV